MFEILLTMSSCRTAGAITRLASKSTPSGKIRMVQVIRKSLNVVRLRDVVANSGSGFVLLTYPVPESFD